MLANAQIAASRILCFGTLARLAAPDERGELFAVAFVIAYLSFSLPAVIAGFATTSVGLRLTADVYGIVVVVLSVAALLAQATIAARRRPARACSAGS